MKKDNLQKLFEEELKRTHKVILESLDALSELKESLVKQNKIIDKSENLLDTYAKIIWKDNDESCQTKPTTTLQKHEGWILLIHKPIKMVDGRVTEYSVRLNPRVYSTKEEAILNIGKYTSYNVGITKIEWEDTMKVKFEHERSHTISNLHE